MRWFLLLLLLIAGGAYVYTQEPPPVEQPPGILVDADPLQTDPDRDSWQFENYTVRPLATIDMRARVLGKTKYFFDKESELAPYDLALGWQHMSDTEVLKHISISQAGRWYYMSWEELPPNAMDPNVYSANMHVIPGNEKALDTIKNIREGQLVNMKGYLVQVIANDDDWAWTSSTSRYDLGQSSCELVWVQNISVEK
ncbi:MAG: hypothetical protein AB7L92_04815 [Alphaproteobacteria bacterium]